MNSIDTTAVEFIDGLVKFSKGKMNNREDIERIIELSFQHNNKPVLEDLVFHAKYLKGIKRIIQTKDNSLDEEYYLKMEKVYGEHIEKVKEFFLIIMEPASDFIKEIFRKKYFELTVPGFEIFTGLCDDLSKVKSYLNELEEGGKGF